MKIQKILGFFLITGFIMALTFSCDKVEPPYVEDGYDTVIYPEYPKKILVEDYTAHMCTYCPDGHHALEAMKEKYEKDYYDGYVIIPMAIHVSSLAVPAPPSFPTDFRTEEGDALDAYYGASTMGLPKGLINRTSWEGNLLLGPDAWADIAAVEIENDQAAVKLTIQEAEIYLIIQNQYDTATRQLNSDIEAMILADQNNATKIAVFIVEDGIVSGQLNHGNIDENYVHNHVLRDGITDTWGETLSSSAVSSGESINKSYMHTLSEDFVADNCYVVAYVFDETTGEVIQAEMEKITE